MGKAARDKGRRGQLAARHLLADRDWVVAELNSGQQVEDLIATDPLGVTWAVEVKNTVNIAQAHRTQAIEQAEKRKLRWMLMSKIVGTNFWLVQRKGCAPIVWKGKDNAKN